MSNPVHPTMKRIEVNEAELQQMFEQDAILQRYLRDIEKWQVARDAHRKRWDDEIAKLKEQIAECRKRETALRNERSSIQGKINLYLAYKSSFMPGEYNRLQSVIGGRRRYIKRLAKARVAKQAAIAVNELLKEMI